MNLNRLVNITSALKAKRSGRCLHTTFILDKSRIISIGVNNYNKIHPYHKFGKYYPYKDSGGNNKYYTPGLHSEVSALIKLGEENCSRYTFVNVRIDKRGNLAIAKPCKNCCRVLNQVGFKRIVWSVPHGFEVFDQNIEHLYQHQG